MEVGKSDWVGDVFWRKSQQDVATLEWRLYLILPCFPLYQAWYLDMVHSLFCFSASNMCALLLYLDVSSNNCQSVWKKIRKHKFFIFYLYNIDFISVLLKKIFGA